MWRTFCLIFLGTNVASAALLRHDQKVSRADGKVQEKDLLDMLTSLNEVVVGMDKEHKAFRDLSNARETSCRTIKAKLEKSLKDGNSSLLTAKQELSNAMSEVDSIQGGVDSIKEQVKAIDGEISGLQDQLAKLRADRQAAVARDSGYTQQVKAILEKAQQRISQVWTRSGAHKSAKSQEEESEDGASLVSLSESDQDDDPEKRTAATEGKKALAADAASVTKAAKKAREAFELQELKLLDLIKSKRQALKPLQGNLAKQQPELADQLRKISEANRSVAMTKHALKRDQKVLERSQSKCAVLSKAKKFEEDQRPQVRVQVIMAISFLKAMARKAGIDLNPGAVGPSFLQLDSKDSELSEAVRSALHHIESLDASRYEVNFQAEASNESDDAVTVPLESNLVQVDAAQKVASSEAADSLKNVKEMIANLIASLREEQNEDQGKQKFCADQLKKAQEKTKKLKTAQEEVEQSKRWAENAVNDLKVQSRFIEGEVKLLKEAKTSSKEELDAEEKRVKDEVNNHEATTDVMSKSQQVLVTQCELSDDLSSNCAEANAALRRATNGLKELDKYLASYLVEFSKVAEEQQAAIDKTLSAQEGSLFQTKADPNRRKDELAQLNADVVTAKENAILASKADSALATNCGPKVSSAEELIATRKEQIEQLKNAVKVLDGQAFV